VTLIQRQRDRCTFWPGRTNGGNGAPWRSTSPSGQDDLDDIFASGDLIAHDPLDLVQKAVGGWIRETGKRGPATTASLPRPGAATVPRGAVQWAISQAYVVELAPDVVQDRPCGDRSGSRWVIRVCRRIAAKACASSK
jgi:hypothetical protein